jgi:nucleotide-binding universal stress UspA family protein
MTGSFVRVRPGTSRRAAAHCLWAALQGKRLDVPRILVAVDSTEGSRRAAGFVDRFFAGMDVAITAVNVARNPGDAVPLVPFGGVFPWGPAGPDVAAGDRAAWEEAVARERQAGEAVALAQAPADAEVEVVFGEVVEAVLHAADDEDADLIVVGSNDKGFLQRLLGGSVSEALARKAPRPVLIVR